METARIKYGQGAGGFLNPPGHPEHTISVETNLQCRPDNRGSMSLSYAAACEYIPAEVREQAARILQEWQPFALADRAVDLWLRRAFTYFHSCYRGSGEGPEAWHAGNLEITNESRPIELSAAVHLIRQYYPQFAEGHEGDTAALESLYPTGCGMCGHHVNAHANGEGGPCTVITVPLKDGKGPGRYSADELCKCRGFAV